MEGTKMAIEIPDNWMGEPIQGSMKKILAQKKQEPQQPVQTNTPNLDGFEYVPSIGLYVSKQKELHNKDWNESRTELHSRGDRMPTPYEFVEFIKHLRGRNTDEARGVLDEIYKVEGNWRSEWLDARFGSGVMKYHIFGDGRIEEKEHNLAGVLIESKTPGINLDAWLNENEFGLPKSNVGDGQLYYWKPVNGRVAGFDADSNRVYLDCDRNPDYRVTSLGVRAVRRQRENFSGGKSK